MSTFMTIIGGGILALFLAGYYGQKYLPPPPPKIFGIDLGTTFSCIGAFYPGTGEVKILKNEDGYQCIPSVIAISDSGEVLVGYAATKQADHNPANTFFDAKRFIGKKFNQVDLDIESLRYPFKLILNEDGSVSFKSTKNLILSPEEVGAHILTTLANTARNHFWTPVKKVVMSVPAEFDETQRAYTVKAGKLANLGVMRLINEPTAAALAYGLHNKTGVQAILVVDLGGGTLDVSLLDIQGGMFLTRAMAGNNRLGGQDFNERLRTHFTTYLQNRLDKSIIDSNDIQLLRDSVEATKIALTFDERISVAFKLNANASNTGDGALFDLQHGFNISVVGDERERVANSVDGSSDSDYRSDPEYRGQKSNSDISGFNADNLGFKNDDNSRGSDSKNSFSDLNSAEPKIKSENREGSTISLSIDRTTFEALNYDLFLSILEPIGRVIEESELSPSEVEEIVLVGGSTRIPKVRQIISEFFGGRRVRTDVDPEIAVAIGVSLQAGIMGGSWPLSVSALEVPYSAYKKTIL